MTLENLSYGDRIPVLKVLTGSHNYNLNTPESDKDYKLFVLPTFDDLYNKNSYTEAIVTDEEDCTVYDLRKVAHLFWAANVNYLEVLYSVDTEILLSESAPGYKELKDILNHKEQLCKMNLSYLYHASRGMSFNKRNDMMKKKNKDFKEDLGYAPKHAMSAYRILDFLERYKNNLNSNIPDAFKKAICYSDEEKEELLNIRKGIYSLEQINSVLDRKYKQIVESCADFYLEKEVDEALNSWLIDKLKIIVKGNI